VAKGVVGKCCLARAFRERCSARGTLALNVFPFNRTDTPAPSPWRVPFAVAATSTNPSARVVEREDDAPLVAIGFHLTIVHGHPHVIDSTNCRGFSRQRQRRLAIRLLRKRLPSFRTATPAKRS